MGLCPSLFLLLNSLLSPLNLLLHLIFSLLYETGLEPLLKLHVGYLLFLLLLKLLNLVFLHFLKLLVMDIHDLFVLPLVHLVGALLHSDGFFLLFLDKGLEKVTLGFQNQFLPKLGLVIFAAGPFRVADFDRVFLKLKGFGSLTATRLLALQSDTASLGCYWDILPALVDSLIDQLFDLRIGVAHGPTI